jgi:hypothetical protein
MLKHARDCKLQVFANILLKVNAKLGGLNAIPDTPIINDGDTEATIIFGMYYCNHSCITVSYIYCHVPVNGVVYFATLTPFTPDKAS